MSRMSLARAAALAALMGFAAAPVRASAQAAGPPADPLTLEQALALAERNNPGYRQATNDLERNGIESRQQWLNILPTPNLDLMSTSMSWNLQRVGTDNFGNPVPNPEPRMIQSSRSNQTASLGFQLNFADFLQFRQAGLRAEGREINAITELHNLRTDVRRTFLDAQERQLTVELETDLLETERSNQEAAQRLFALARRERLDLLEAELGVAEQEETLRQSRANLSNALLALRNVMGDGSLTLTAVDPIPLRSLDPSRLDEEALVRAALASSPRIRQQQAQIEIAQREVSLVRSQWLPTLAFQVNTGRTELDRGGGGAFFQPNPSSDWDRNISVSLRFPNLGEHFTRQNDTRSRQLTVRNQQETLRQIRLDVEQEVRSALVALRSEHGSLELLEKRVAVSEERLKLQEESYRLGRGTFMDLQQASNAAALARRNLLQRRYQFERALVTLEQTLGMPLDGILELGGS